MKHPWICARTLNGVTMIIDTLSCVLAMLAWHGSVQPLADGFCPRVLRLQFLQRLLHSIFCAGQDCSLQCDQHLLWVCRWGGNRVSTRGRGQFRALAVLAFADCMQKFVGGSMLTVWPTVSYVALHTCFDSTCRQLQFVIKCNAFRSLKFC